MRDAPGRLGILGGTFDPVHNTHLAMAHAALDTLHLDKLIFLPTGNPQYRTPARTAATHRVAMLKLALAGEQRMEVDERELAAGASPYTVDTLKNLKAELGEAAELHFLMGADQLEKLDSWHRPDEVRGLARLAVFARPGHEAKEAGVQVIPMPPSGVSSTDIRARAKRGESLASLVPPAVANYIQEHRLYR